MDISDFLTGEELVQTKTLVGEESVRQRRFKAESSFDGDWFDLPSGFSFFREKLPDFLADFMGEMHCARFDKMLPESRRLLWYGILLFHGLSKSDFPYPYKLEKLDHPESPAIDTSTFMLHGPNVFRNIRKLGTLMMTMLILSVGLSTILSGLIIALIHHKDRSSLSRNVGRPVLQMAPPLPSIRSEQRESPSVPGSIGMGAIRSPE